VARRGGHRIALNEKFPATDPLTVALTDLQPLRDRAAGLRRRPKASNEKFLEAIQDGVAG